MVLFTVTSRTIDALQHCRQLNHPDLTSFYSSSSRNYDENHDRIAHIANNNDQTQDDEIHLRNKDDTWVCPRIGDPIAHTHLIALAHVLESSVTPGHAPLMRLHDLLHGSAVYVPPRSAPVRKSASYEALMARLRRDDEARQYARMLAPPGDMAAAESNPPSQATRDDDEDEEVTYAEVKRQVALIINVLVSIIACSAALWIAARRWAVPARLALSMSGSILVAVAEVVIYAGYIGRIREAKVRERKKPERRAVLETWVIGRDDDPVTNVVIPKQGASALDSAEKPRQRLGAAKPK